MIVLLKISALILMVGMHKIKFNSSRHPEEFN